MLILILLISFLTSFALFPAMIFRLKKAGIVGKNMNSEAQEEVAEMSGHCCRFWSRHIYRDCS